MKIDRQYQSEFLNGLLANFPNYTNIQTAKHQINDDEYINLYANIEYISQKGLIECSITKPDNEKRAIIEKVRITARGIDYLNENNLLNKDTLDLVSLGF